VSKHDEKDDSTNDGAGDEGRLETDVIARPAHEQRAQRRPSAQDEAVEAEHTAAHFRGDIRLDHALNTRSQDNHRNSEYGEKGCRQPKGADRDHKRIGNSDDEERADDHACHSMQVPALCEPKATRDRPEPHRGDQYRETIGAPAKDRIRYAGEEFGERTGEQRTGRDDKKQRSDQRMTRGIVHCLGDLGYYPSAKGYSQPYSGRRHGA
jgi:hypothetical protein